MCGLVGGYGLLSGQLDAGLAAIQHRGPDATGSHFDPSGWALGHTLLSIQGRSNPTRQPYTHDHIVLTYNGEQWSTMGGDTSLVASDLARSTDLATTLSGLDGMFALAWVDTRSGDAYLTRDTYGEVPLHYGLGPKGLVWASEIKALTALGVDPRSVRWFPPGHLLRVSPDQKMTWQRWAIAPSFAATDADAETLADAMDMAVASRLVSRIETPVAVLLSGGLDSSIITASMLRQGYTPHAYTAVFDPRSADLRVARKLAAEWGIELTEVQVPTPDAASLSAAVRAAEMPHKAQVEITLGCQALARQIAADGYRVVLSGEGSDELWASYGMSYYGIKTKGWNRYRWETYTGQHRKNFPRTNKVFMAAGIEARLPFLDPPLAELAFGMSEQQVRVADDRKHPKAILAAAACLRHASREVAVPREIAWRTKRAFQTEAGLDSAAAAAVAEPAAYYRAEFTTAFGGVKP